jgi:DNA-binding MarR family transcriptional regulator
MDKHFLKQAIDRFESSTFNINRIMNAMMRDLMPENLTNEQHSILRCVRERETCTSSELADFFCVGKSSITAIVTRLADKNLLERLPDEKDRRVIYLRLTPDGERLVEEMTAKIEELLSGIIVHFDEQEATAFLETYEKLARILIQTEEGRNR